MGKPSSLAQVGVHELGDIPYVRNIIWDILLLPNPALIFIVWCPIVWTTCLACHTSEIPIQASDLSISLVKNFVIIALIYSSYCSLNNVISRSHDGEPPRAPSQNYFLLLVYLSRVFGIVATIYYLQGRDFLLLWLPCFIMSTLYPLVKNHGGFKQFSLSCSVTSAVLPAWMSSGGKFELREDLIVLSLFTILWIIYIDVLHAAMDSTHSSLAHTHYLSPSPTTHLILTLLSLLQLTTLSIYSYQTSKSPHFWILGVGIWVVNNVWHISELRNVDWLWNEMSGRVAVQRNIWLGLWMCGAEICELWVGGGLVF